MFDERARITIIKVVENWPLKFEKFSTIKLVYTYRRAQRRINWLSSLRYAEYVLAVSNLPQNDD